MFSRCAVPNVFWNQSACAAILQLSIGSIKFVRLGNEDSSVGNGTACCGHGSQGGCFELVVLQVHLEGREKIDGKFRLAGAWFFPCSDGLVGGPSGFGRSSRRGGF